eukprot:UN27238
MHYNIEGLDALLITHDHADATLGIDDLRMTQRAMPLNIYASERDMKSLADKFHYLMPKTKMTAEERKKRFEEKRTRTKNDYLLLIWNGIL